MALTKFVRNVTDLSDDGGYKFRFCCDLCEDGIESQYISSSANLLKTAMDVFLTFRPFGSGDCGAKSAMRPTSERSHKPWFTSKSAPHAAAGSAPSGFRLW